MKANESGNGFLEILLFAPVGLLLVLLSLNCILGIRERSIVLDAVRSGLNEQARTNREFSPSSTDIFSRIDGLGRQSDRERQTVDLIAESVGKNILRALESNGRSVTDFRVRGYLLTADIDPGSGALLGSALESRTGTFPRGSTFSLESKFPNYRFVPVEEFVRTFLDGERERIPSSLATPVTRQFESSSSGYLPVAAGIVIEVSASARALPLDVLVSSFGNLNAIHELVIFPVRNSFG